MFYSALAFLFGIVVIQQLSSLPGLSWIAFFVLLAISAAKHRVWALFFFLMGILWVSIYANQRLNDRLLENLEGQVIQVQGKVIGLPEYDDRKVRFDFEVTKPDLKFPDKIRLNWYFPKYAVKTGQYWQFAVKLKQPHGMFNSGGFDYEKWLFINKIGATGYVRNESQPTLIKADEFWLNIDVVREDIAEKLSALMPNSQYRGLVKALTIGDRNELSKDQWYVFKTTGTIHLLAISGLHIGLLAGFSYFLGLRISFVLKLQSPQQIAAVVAIIMAVLYSALAGFSLPTQRALLMLSVAMIAIFCQRHIKVTQPLSLALFVVLIFDPLAVLSVGFWLSFLAVLMIILGVASRLGRAHYWQSAFKIHWVSAIGLSPLLVFYFQQISIVAPLANFIMVPVVSFIVVPLCLLAVLLMYLVPWIAETILLTIDFIFNGLWLFLSESAELPYAALNTDSPPFYAVLLAISGCLILFAPKGIPARWLGLVMLLPLMFVNQHKVEEGALRITLLDVGQGLSALLETESHILLFDAGAKYSATFDIGEAVILPYLKSKGIDTIDILLISHSDNDHIGGSHSIIEQSNIQKILTSSPESFKTNNPVKCQAGQSWLWDQVIFEILSPELNTLVGENNNSCVLKVTSRHGSILLPADIEYQAENLLVKQYGKQLKSTVLISPHHGSKTSSSTIFLNQVQPEIVLIPAGYKNRFSFPHQIIVERYLDHSIKMLNVAVEGAITVTMENDKIMVQTARNENRKYWNY